MDMGMEYQPKGNKGTRSKSEIVPKELMDSYNKLKDTSETYIEDLEKGEDKEVRMDGIIKYTEQSLTLIDDLSIYHGRELWSVRRVYDRLSDSVKLVSEYMDRTILMMDKEIKILNERIELGKKMNELWQVYVDGGELDSEKGEENEAALEQMEKDLEMLSDDATLLEGKTFDEGARSARLFEELVKKLEPLIPE